MAWFGSPEGHSKAGKLGGAKTVATYSRKHFQKIGKMGSEVFKETRFLPGDQRPSDLGKLGAAVKKKKKEQAANDSV